MRKLLFTLPLVATAFLSACSNATLESAACASSEAVSSLRADSDYTTLTHDEWVDKEGFKTLILPRPSLFASQDTPPTTLCEATIATEGSISAFHQHVHEVLGEVGVMAVHSFRDADEETGLIADFVDALDALVKSHPDERLTLVFEVLYSVDPITGSFLSFKPVPDGQHQSSISQAYYDALKQLNTIQEASL